MYFFEVKANKQFVIMQRALPHLKPFVDEFRRIAELQSGGEAMKKAKQAQQELIIAEAALLTKKDDPEAKEAAVQARVKASAAIDAGNAEQLTAGLDLLWSVVENALTTHYGEALNVLALFNNKTTDQLEDEKDIFELGEMLFDILENKKVAGFLSRVQRLRSKTPRDTSQE